MSIYLFTAFMVIICIIFILTVVKITELKRYIQSREKYYIERIDGIEAVVRTEFKAVVSELKKVINGR